MLEELRITDSQTAITLTSQVGTHYLSPYFSQDRSISEAADYLSEPIGKVHYWTRKWHDLGLLEITERRARAGRPITFYRAIAKKFIVPDALLPETLLERQLNTINQAMLENLRAAVPEVAYSGELTVWQPPGQRGTQVDRGRGGQPARRRGALHSSFQVLLTLDEAVQLRDELDALRNRWLERAGGDDRHSDQPGFSEYAVIVATAPVKG